jgi:ACS family pantothenate transporter-like MFS transporter
MRSNLLSSFLLYELELTKERMARVGRVPEGKPYTVKILLGCFASWKTLFFTFIFSKLRHPLPQT